MWHILDVRAIWIKEFAAALSALTPTLGWYPKISSAGIFQRQENEAILDNPPLRVRYFPLQRGFSKFPVSLITGEANRIRRRLSPSSENASDSVLVCCSPHYGPVAELWPGPVVYYVTDLFTAYGESPAFIRRMERRMCRTATLVCPNSERIAGHLTTN